MKTKTKETYLSPAAQCARVELEESVVAVQSPVNNVTVEDWEDGGGNAPGDSGNIYLGL